MAHGTFWVREAQATKDPPSCVFIGRVQSGTVVPGMTLAVPFNGSVSMTIRIGSVGYWEGTDEMTLRLDCSDAEEVGLVMDLNISDEELQCRDQAE
jgi:hypothetical protein